jgi:hypothetical protein
MKGSVLTKTENEALRNMLGDYLLGDEDVILRALKEWVRTRALPVEGLKMKWRFFLSEGAPYLAEARNAVVLKERKRRWEENEAKVKRILSERGESRIPEAFFLTLSQKIQNAIREGKFRTFSEEQETAFALTADKFEEWNAGPGRKSR